MCLEQEHKPKSKNINPEIKKKTKQKKNPKTFWTNFKSSARVSPSFIIALLSLISKRNHG